MSGQAAAEQAAVTRVDVYPEYIDVNAFGLDGKPVSYRVHASHEAEREYGGSLAINVPRFVSGRDNIERVAERHLGTPLFSYYRGQTTIYRQNDAGEWVKVDE